MVKTTPPIPIEDALLLLSSALEGRLEEADRPQLEQALLDHPGLRVAAADIALATAAQSTDPSETLPLGLSRAARQAHAHTTWPSWIAPLRLVASITIMISAGLLGWSLGSPVEAGSGLDILEAHFGLESTEAIDRTGEDMLWQEFGT